MYEIISRSLRNNMQFLCFIIERDALAEMFFGRRRDADSTNKQLLFLVWEWFINIPACRV